MKTEINIEISINDSEKSVLNDAYGVFAVIEGSLGDLKANGHYPFIDYVRLPQEVRDIISIAKRVYELSQPGYY